MAYYGNHFLKPEIMKKKVKVILLPTDDKKATIHRIKSSGNLVMGEKCEEFEPYTNLISQHLYITSDEEIRELPK